MATVRYMISDTDASISFYTELLGFEIQMQTPNFSVISRGDLNIWLSNPKTSARQAMSDGSEPEPGGWNRFVIEFDDLESVVERLTKAGVKFRNEILSGVGGKQILAEDPDGNPIELFQAAGAVHA